MAIGRWKSVCINVTDLEQGFDFWSEVLGWTTNRKSWHGWLGYLSDPETDNYMILNDATKAPVKLNPPTHDETNRVHIDIWPNDGMDNAIRDIIALGGRVKKPPSLYPRPGPYGFARPEYILLLLHLLLQEARRPKNGPLPSPCPDRAAGEN